MNVEQYEIVTDNAFQVSNDSVAGLWNGIVAEYSAQREADYSKSQSFEQYEEISEFMLRYKLGQLPRWKNYVESVQPFVGNPDLFIEIIPKIIEANRALLFQIEKTKMQLLSKENKNGE